MEKSSRQKLRLLYLMDFLLQETDDEHAVTLAEITEYLESRELGCERKTLYDDLETLRQYGMDIVTGREGNITRYAVASRPFQLPELRLLVDSVQSSKFITQKKSLELIKKLEGLTSRHNGKLLHRQVYVTRRIKSMNESIYYNVDKIHSAIGEDRQISFRYWMWNEARQKIYRHEGERYLVSPFALMWDDENYYLLGYDSRESILKHYRVDKMDTIQLEEKTRDGKEAFAAIDMAVYSESHFGMFSGTTQQVKLELQNRLAGPVIDRFGKDTILIPGKNGTFTVTVSAAVNSQLFGWLCSFGDGVRILAPEEAVTGMREHIQKIAGLYGGEKEPET